MYSCSLRYKDTNLKAIHNYDDDEVKDVELFLTV